MWALNGRHSLGMMSNLASGGDFLGAGRLDTERLKVQGQEDITGQAWRGWSISEGGEAAEKVGGRADTELPGLPESL